MQYIGINHDGDTWAAALHGTTLDGARVFPLAPVTDFWADADGWQEKALSLVEGAGSLSLERRTVTEVPLVPASARVICVGLNYKAHAAEGSYKDQELPPYPTLFGRWTASPVRRERPGPGAGRRGRPGLGRRSGRLHRQARGVRDRGPGRRGHLRLLHLQRHHGPARPEAHDAVDPSARTATSPARWDRWSAATRRATCATASRSGPASTAPRSSTATPGT
jgi:hypothetical protein